MAAGHVAAVCQVKPKLADSLQRKQTRPARVVQLLHFGYPGHQPHGAQIAIGRLTRRQFAQDVVGKRIRYEPVGAFFGEIDRRVAVGEANPWEMGPRHRNAAHWSWLSFRGKHHLKIIDFDQPSS